MPPDSSTGNDADLYSMGKILYCVFTGKPVQYFPTLPDRFLSAKSPVIMRLNKVAIKACSKIPENRFKSVSQFKSALMGDSVAMKGKANFFILFMLPITLVFTTLLCIGYFYSDILFKKSETKIHNADKIEMEKELQMLNTYMTSGEWQRAIDTVTLIKEKYPQSDNTHLDKIVERVRTEIAKTLAQAETEKAKLELEKAKLESEKVKLETKKMLAEKEKSQTIVKQPVTEAGKTSTEIEKPKGEPLKESPSTEPKTDTGTVIAKEEKPVDRKMFEVEGAEFAPFKKGESLISGKKSDVWGEIPETLNGMLFSRYLNRQTVTARVKFLEDGVFYMAVTTRWLGKDNGGDWQKECLNDTQIKNLGWKEVDRAQSSYLDWIVYKKNCKKGEVFNYRTEKYIAPVIMGDVEKINGGSLKGNGTDKKSLFNLDDYKWNGAISPQQMDDGTVMLTAKGDESILHSVKYYSPPFTLKTEVQTDSNEIRFYYNKGRFIFGYSVGENQFRYRDILTRNEGGLSDISFKPNKIHIVEIEVGKKSMSVRLDNNEIFHRKDDYKDISAPIGIGPAFDSKIAIKSITFGDADIVENEILSNPASDKEATVVQKTNSIDLLKEFESGKWTNLLLGRGEMVKLKENYYRVMPIPGSGSDFAWSYPIKKSVVNFEMKFRLSNNGAIQIVFEKEPQIITGHGVSLSYNWNKGFSVGNLSSRGKDMKTVNIPDLSEGWHAIIITAKNGYISAKLDNGKTVEWKGEFKPTVLTISGDEFIDWYIKDMELK
jgi:hypothetical protein